MRPDLIRWQWDGYPEFHRTRLTLWIHLFAVPAFIVSSLSAFASLVMLQWLGAVGALGATAVAFGLQGFAHRREPAPPIPFDGPLDAVRRILSEQFINFPRFVLTGRWTAALRAAGSRTERSPT